MARTRLLIHSVFLFLLPLILAGCASDGNDIDTPLQPEQHAPQIGCLRGFPRQDGAACRTRLDQPDREPGRGFHRSQATARGHQQKRTPKSALGQFTVQALQIAGHQRPHVGVRDRRVGALVLSRFRRQAV
mgnify:CR=1 FL=1